MKEILPSVKRTINPPFKYLFQNVEIHKKELENYKNKVLGIENYELIK